MIICAVPLAEGLASSYEEPFGKSLITVISIVQKLKTSLQWMQETTVPYKLFNSAAIIF